jgi:hypothetical protein
VSSEHNLCSEYSKPSKLCEYSEDSWYGLEPNRWIMRYGGTLQHMRTRPRASERKVPMINSNSRCGHEQHGSGRRQQEEEDSGGQQRRTTEEDNRGGQQRRTVEEYRKGGWWKVVEPDSTSGPDPELE